MPDKLRWPSWLLAAAVFALALRLLGVAWGLPQGYNADEPHLVNLAVSFGSGSLNPYAFKYPTLWPYLLAACYGAYFVLWSGFGLLAGPADFAALYGWDPGGFYLIARLLSALFSTAALGWVLGAEARLRKGLPWAVLLLAVAPVLVELGRAGKPDSLMFFFACAAWNRALAAYAGEGRRAFLLCGLFLGLAASAQYTAAPLALLLPLAFVLGKKGKAAWLLEGLGAAAGGFLLGSPFVLLDFPRFWRAAQDMAAFRGLADQSEILVQVLANLGSFAGSGSIAGLAALAGLVFLARRSWRLSALLFVPVLAYALILGASPDGGWARYLLPVFPALALLAGEALSLCEKPGRRLLLALALIAALVPGAGISWARGAALMLPDTRVEASAWLQGNLPQGEGVLLDLPHASPDLPMERAQLEELAARLGKRGSPRARLYEAMAARHPGGGFRVYRLQRGAHELRSWPGHVEASQADYPMLDARPGLDVARAMKVRWVVTTSFGAIPERAPELATFFSELYRSARLAMVFAPVPGRSTGPVLRVFSLD